MANKEVNLVIRLKDGVTGVLGHIRGGISATIRTFRNLAIAGVAAGVAITAAIVKVAKVYAIQNKAEVDLAAAIRKTGDSVRSTMKDFRAYASSVQAVTKYGDEGILSAMSYGLNLGITTDRIKEATTAAIGLAAKFKIDLQTAMMLVGRAAMGQTQMLTRYGIVLEETLSPQEKFNQLLKIGASAFDLAEAETESLAGAWEQLKNSIGDAIEEIGRGLFGGGGFISGIKQVRKALDDLVKGGAIEAWASKAADAFANIAAAAKIILTGTGEGGVSRGEVLRAFADVIKGVFVDSAGFLSAKIKDVFGASGLAFVKDIATTLLDIAPRIGTMIAASMADYADRKFREQQARNEATNQARAELGERPPLSRWGALGEKFGVEDPAADARKEYFKNLDELTEKYYAESIAKLDKAQEEAQKQIVDDYVSGIEQRSALAQLGGQAQPDPEQRNTTEAAKDTTKAVDKTTDAIQELHGDWANTNAALNRISGLLAPTVEQITKTKPPELAELLEMMMESAIPDGRKAKEKAEKLLDEMLDLVPAPKKSFFSGPITRLSGLTDEQEKAAGLLGRPVQSQMMGMQQLGSRMMGGGQTLGGNMLGQGGQPGGAHMMGVNPAATALSDDIRKAMNEAKPTDEGNETKKVAEDIYTQLKSMYELMDERLGGVSGG